jgi:flagellar basal body-associated protein FliL
MKGGELLGEILRPAAKALGWIIAGALLVMFIWAVVTYVVPVIRRRLYGNE